MIVEFIMTALASSVEALVSLLPEVTVPFGSTLSAFADFIGSQLNGLDNILPISEMAAPVGWALTVYLPFVIAYYVFRWIYDVIPVFGR